MRLVPFALALAALVAARSDPSRAAALTGTLAPEYGAPIAEQTTQAALDATIGSGIYRAAGSELDAAYAYVSGDTLHLFFSGNTFFWLQLEGLITHCQPLDVFIDSRPGGQNVLLAGNPNIDWTGDLTRMTGLRFDAGFEADWWFALGSQNWPALRAYSAELPTGGGGEGAFLGGTSCGGPGTLSGGTNPFGILATLDDRNMAGVTQGCGASSGAGVTTGFEWAIPLSAIGNPTGCIRVCALLAEIDHSRVLNQVLGPLPAGTCDLGPSGSVDFGAIAGEQFFTICLPQVPVRNATWGGLKSRYR